MSCAAAPSSPSALLSATAAASERYTDSWNLMLRELLSFLHAHNRVPSLRNGSVPAEQALALWMEVQVQNFPGRRGAFKNNPESHANWNALVTDKRWVLAFANTCVEAWHLALADVRAHLLRTDVWPEAASPLGTWCELQRTLAAGRRGLMMLPSVHEAWVQFLKDVEGNVAHWVYLFLLARAQMRGCPPPAPPAFAVSVAAEWIDKPWRCSEWMRAQTTAFHARTAPFDTSRHAHMAWDHMLRDANFAHVLPVCVFPNFLAAATKCVLWSLRLRRLARTDPDNHSLEDICWLVLQHDHRERYLGVMTNACCRDTWDHFTATGEWTAPNWGRGASVQQVRAQPKSQNDVDRVLQLLTVDYAAIETLSETEIAERLRACITAVARMHKQAAAAKTRAPCIVPHVVSCGADLAACIVDTVSTNSAPAGRATRTVRRWFLHLNDLCEQLRTRNGDWARIDIELRQWYDTQRKAFVDQTGIMLQEEVRVAWLRFIGGGHVPHTPVPKQV